MVAIATLRSGLSAEQIEELRRLAEQLDAAPSKPPEPAAPGQVAAAPGREPDRPEAASAAGKQAAPGRHPARRPVNRMAPVGQTVRAEVASGAMPELPSFVVACWSCGEPFPLGSIAGTRSARACPLCGAPLHESLYDSRAAEVLASEALREFREAREGVRLVEERRAENRRQRLGLKRLVAALRIWRDRRRARKRFEAARAEGLREEQRLFSLARARYFTGRWYLDTRAELSEPRQGGTEGYRLEPSYRDDGAFELSRLDAGTDMVGLVGEFAAFEAIRETLERARGTLEGAALVADLYLPRGAFGQGGRHQRWSQVDQVVVTTRAVLVVEVKSTRRLVKVRGDFESLTSAKGPGSRARPFSEPLRQARDHARDLELLLPAIPRDRFFRAVAFVGEGRVMGGPDGFRERAYVGSLQHGGDELLSRFAEAIRGLEPFTSPAGVAAIAKELQRLTDPTHVKHAEHLEDLAATGRLRRGR